MKILTDFIVEPWGAMELPIDTFRWFVSHGILYHPESGDKRYPTMILPYTRNVADFGYKRETVVEFNPHPIYNKYYLIYQKPTLDSDRIITLEIFDKFTDIPYRRWIEDLKQTTRYLRKDIVVDYLPSPATGIPSRLNFIFDLHRGGEYTCMYCKGEGTVGGRRLAVDDYQEDDCPICDGSCYRPVTSFQDDNLAILERTLKR